MEELFRIHLIVESFDFSLNRAGGLVFHLETDDVDAAISTAVTAGAAITSEIAENEDGCCGGVVGKVKDPFGVSWIVASDGKKRSVEPQAAA